MENLDNNKSFDNYGYKPQAELIALVENPERISLEDFIGFDEKHWSAIGAMLHSLEGILVSFDFSEYNQIQEELHLRTDLEDMYQRGILPKELKEIQQNLIRLSFAYSQGITIIDNPASEPMDIYPKAMLVLVLDLIYEATWELNEGLKHVGEEEGIPSTLLRLQDTLKAINAVYSNIFTSSHAKPAIEYIDDLTFFYHENGKSYEEELNSPSLTTEAKIFKGYMLIKRELL